MATYLGKSLVNHMFSLCLFVALVVSHLSFKGGNLVLIVPVPGHCFLFDSTATYPGQLNLVPLFSHNNFIQQSDMQIRYFA